jgi:hypothetical protein
VTVWYDGDDNTKVIRPDGTVENMTAMLKPHKVPNDTDERAFYMTIVINALAKDGFEPVSWVNKDTLMRRPVSR